MVGLSAVAEAQVPLSGTAIYPERLHEDVEAIRALVDRMHPDPYRYCSRAEFDRLFDNAIDSIKIPLGTNEFLEVLLPIFHRIGDSRLVPELDRPTDEALHRDMPVLPLKVRVLEEGLFVDEEMKGFRSIPPGSKVFSINGVPAGRLLEKLGRLVVTDGANQSLRWHLVEQDFPWLFHRAFGSTASYSVMIEMPDGGKEERTLFAMTGAESERTRKPVADATLPWGSTWEAESATLWATLRTMDPGPILASGQSSRKFLSSMLKDLRKNNAKTLVLDLRGSDGPELGMAEQVFATIARSPFRVVQGMTVRNGPSPEGFALAVSQPEHYASLFDGYEKGSDGFSSLRPDDPRLELTDPDPDAFAGKVYVVCDGGTRGAAAALVMLAKRQGRARVIGEETGTNAYSFTGGRDLLLVTPNAGIRLRVPLVRYVPDGEPAGPRDHGEVPKQVVQQRPWGIAKGRDTIRMALLEMIRELQ